MNTHKHVHNRVNKGNNNVKLSKNIDRKQKIDYYKNTDKLSKKINKKTIVGYNKHWTNYEKIIGIDKNSSVQFNKLKIKTLALGNINLICDQQIMVSHRFDFMMDYCNACHNITCDWNMSIYTLYNENINICELCSVEMDTQYNLMKKSIVEKFICIKHILHRLLLQDLYTDMVIEYFILTLTHNTRVLRELFIYDGNVSRYIYK